MRDADQHLGDSKLLDDVASAPPQSHRGPAARFVADFHVAPADAFSPPGAECFENGLFSGPTAGEVLCGQLAALAILDFVLRVHAVDEQLAVALDHLRDSQTLDDVS